MMSRTDGHLALAMLLASACSTSVDGDGSGGSSTSGTSTVDSTTTAGGGEAGGLPTGSTSTGGTAQGGSGGGVEVSPTPEECEAFTTEEECLGAGCRLWKRVGFMQTGEPDVCGDATAEERDMCFQLRPDETYSYPATGLWYREKSGSLEVMHMLSSYCGLLGWTPCANDPDLDPTPLCECVYQVCADP